ncbi:MAG: hypothetical protein ABI775_07295 [Pseudonocardiales bacterium]
MSTAPRRRPRLLTLGAELALLGGGLGVLAGLTQTLAGSHIPDWSGNKSNSVGLGLLTVALSLVAVGCALTLRATHPATAGRSAAGLTGLVIPAAVCFSTAGRLWWIPGTLLLLAAASIAAASDLRGMAVTIRAHWARILISVLGAYLLLIAVSAAPLGMLVLGMASGAVLAGAAWVPLHPVARLALIVLATVPFAVLTWTSLATPLIALLAVALWFTGRSSVELAPRRPTAPARIRAAA